MDTKKELLDEMENEAITTRKMLSIVPTEKFEWALPKPRKPSFKREVMNSGIHLFKSELSNPGL